MCGISAQYVKACRWKVWKTGGRRPGQTDGESDGESDGLRVGWTESRTETRTDGHHHIIIRPVWRRAYNKNAIQSCRKLANIYKYSCVKCNHTLPSRKIKYTGHRVSIQGTRIWNNDIHFIVVMALWTSLLLSFCLCCHLWIPNDGQHRICLITFRPINNKPTSGGQVYQMHHRFNVYVKMTFLCCIVQWTMAYPNKSNHLNGFVVKQFVWKARNTK